MIKNEKFYEMAQVFRDDISPSLKYNRRTSLEVVCLIQQELYLNNDEFPDELIFSLYHAHTEMVQDILFHLNIKYDSLSHYGDYFIIRNAQFIK